MQFLSLVACVEICTVSSDPQEITVQVFQQGNQIEGLGAFALPARFVGLARPGVTGALLRFRSGETVPLELTEVDPIGGTARFRLAGALPRQEARQARA